SLDILESAPLEGFDVNIMGSNDYADAANSDVVVITAGKPRTPGMTRADLIHVNSEIVKSVTEQVMKVSPDAFFIIASNPLDTMCYVAKKVGGLKRNRIVGMSGVLDSARMRTFIALELNVAPEDVQAMVLGSHGEDMVPLPRCSTVSGIPITDLMTKEQIERITQRTIDGGKEIVSLLKSGSAYYSPASAIVQMVESVVKNKERVMPCSVYLEGEYGIEGTFTGVPAKLGENGLEGIIEFPLHDDEHRALVSSANRVKEAIKELDIF
ncbi:MAG: malate dehydrogenase, partial [Nitrospinota bacterium]